MSETPPEDGLYPWLPSVKVLAWVKVDNDSDKAANVEVCRQGTADWIEAQRRDLFITVDDVTTFEPTPRIVSAGLLAVARLVARIDSPNGVVSFEELGAGSILSTDPDVRRLLGINRNLAIG